MIPRPVPLRTWITAIIIVAGFGFSGAANWPGHLSYDSVIQLLEGRRAIYANWHPPVMSWMLGWMDAILPGAGLFDLFDSLLVFGTLGLLLWVHPARSWAAAVFALLFAMTPQFLIYPALVWKDVLFAAASVAGFVCLAVAARFWTSPRLRFAFIAGGLLLFVLAALVRQNGILMLPFGAAALGWIAAQRQGARKGAAYGVIAFAVALAFGGASYWALHLRVRGPLGPRAQIALLQSYDIIGAVAADPALKLDAIRKSDPALARLIRTDGVRLYTPERNDTLGDSDELTDALNAAPGLIDAQWRALVREHPGLYLATRWEIFRQVFLTPDISACVPYYLGVDGPADTMQALGYTRRWDARDNALDDYAANFEGTPVFSHVFFAVVALAALVLLLKRGEGPDIALAAMLAAMFAFTASFFAISIACDYRYLYALDLAAMAAVFHIALDPASIAGVWRRRARPRSSAG